MKTQIFVLAAIAVTISIGTAYAAVEPDIKTWVTQQLDELESSILEDLDYVSEDVEELSDEVYDEISDLRVYVDSEAQYSDEHDVIDLLHN